METKVNRIAIHPFGEIIVTDAKNGEGNRKNKYYDLPKIIKDNQKEILKHNINIIEIIDKMIKNKIFYDYEHEKSISNEIDKLKKILSEKWQTFRNWIKNMSNKILQMY